MTPKERAAMQQALDSLEVHQPDPEQQMVTEAITALREALDHFGEANEMVIDWETIGKEQLRRYKEKFGDFEQAEQEPVGVVEGSGEWGIAGVLVAGVPIGTKLYAAPQPDYKALWEQMCKRCDELDSELAKYTEPEPVGWYSHKGGFNECGEGQPLYAAPVRTKDLTDDEIAQACGWKFGQPMYEWVIGLARAVIAKLREKERLK